MGKHKPPINMAAKMRGLGAFRRGMMAERLAKWRLRLSGYNILCQNFKTPEGEIDLIATRYGTLCFIEVKVRRDFTDALYAISSGQKKRIERAAEHFLKKHPHLQSMDIRFDASISSGGFCGKLLTDAWRPGW